VRSTERREELPDVSELGFEIEPHPTPRHYRIAPLPSQIERVKGIPTHPRRQRMELLARSTQPVDASHNRSRIFRRPGMRLAVFAIMRLPWKSHCHFAPAR
jgi:hypothetical protein